jgi:hypothetical protein
MTAPGGHMEGTLTGHRRNGMGTAALVLGIASLVLFWLWFAAIPLGVIAIALGLGGRHRAKRGEATNKGMATGGVVLGGAAVVLAGVLLALGVAFLNSDSGKDYNNCLEKATSQSEKEQCAREFQRDITR